MSHRREDRVRQAVRLALMTAVSFDASMMSHLAIAADQTQSTAQSTKADDLQEIVVTGFRESLETALNRKRDSNQPIESIVAEDIGKMPDQDVSESLQRLPGVSINRSGGKGTQVLIDGLSNNLITLNGEVLLTGREIYVAGESSGGGGNAGLQYASLEGIPSEEVGGIDVIKNPTAQNREGGLGGIIDLKTRSPLAQDMGLNLAGNARGTKAQNADGGVTPVGTLVGGFKFSDDFAITGSVSYDDTKTHDKQFQDQNRNQWLDHQHRDGRILRRQPHRQHQQRAAGRQDLYRSAAGVLQRCPRSDRNQGRNLGRRMEVEREHHQHLQLVLHRRGRDEHHLLQQGVVLRRQRRDQPARSWLSDRSRHRQGDPACRGGTGVVPGHRSRPSPTRSTATESFNRPP